MNFAYFPEHASAVHCDEGFDVIFTGRFELVYREGDRQMSLYCEDGRQPSGEHVVMVGTAGLKAWLPPFAKESISAEKQAQIRSRVIAAVEFMGSNCEFTFPV